ncbi:hypothetical protein L208DRAFT_1478821, partial [Tricholoma matsutake]
KLQYLVHWKGYGYEENSWVQESDVNAPWLVKEFHRWHTAAPCLGQGRGYPWVSNLIPLSLPLNTLPLGVRVWKHIRVAKGMGGFVKGTRVWHKINIFRVKFI